MIELWDGTIPRILPLKRSPNTTVWDAISLAQYSHRPSVSTVNLDGWTFDAHVEKRSRDWSRWFGEIDLRDGNVHFYARCEFSHRSKLHLPVPSVRKASVRKQSGSQSRLRICILKLPHGHFCVRTFVLGRKTMCVFETIHEVGRYRRRRSDINQRSTVSRQLRRDVRSGFSPAWNLTRRFWPLGSYGKSLRGLHFSSAPFQFHFLLKHTKSVQIQTGLGTAAQCPRASSAPRGH